MQVINIPIELLKRYKDNKERKELLSFAIGIKCFHTSSTLTEVSVKKVMSLFHVSHKVAKRLIEAAKNSDLFVYYPKNNSLVVKTFQSQEIKTSIGRTPFKYRSDYCRKIERKNYTLRQITNIITNSLLLNSVNAIDRDNFTQSKMECYAATRGLSVRKLGAIAGISKSQAHRLMNAMYREGIINKASAHAEMVIPHVNESTVKEWNNKTGGKFFLLNPKDGSGWVIHPCRYSVNDRRTTESFKHVIYTHKNRLETFNQSVNTKDPLDKPIFAMYL